MSTDAAAHYPPTPPSEPATTNKNGTMAANSIPRSAPASSSGKQHIWIITGPAGCGKTSVAEYLHQELQLPYLEGDTFHTPENVQKMAAGQPLTDADRWDWLILLREQSLLALTKPSQPNTTTLPAGVIVTCSALKRKYRDVIRIAAYHHTDVDVHFVFLQATEALLMDRVRARQNHYMKDYMVHSQFESLEAPMQDELGRDVLGVDASGTSREVQELALRGVRGVVEGEGR